jgi:hypothetical protein
MRRFAFAPLRRPPPPPFAKKFSVSIPFWESKFFRTYQQLGNLLSLCRVIAGARDILQKFENLKKQHEWNFNL